MTSTRTATMTGGPLDGRTTHYGYNGRLSFVSACNGRSFGYALTGPLDPALVTCRTCHKAAANGRILLADAGR